MNENFVSDIKKEQVLLLLYLLILNNVLTLSGCPSRTGDGSILLI